MQLAWSLATVKLQSKYLYSTVGGMKFEILDDKT